jgi:phosphatidylinositol glycan class B
MATIAPFIIRPLLAVLTQTFFQPDEYFQALEPAHHAVFGYGHLTWEWIAEPPLRSLAYPALWIAVYYVLEITGLDSTSLLVSSEEQYVGSNL